DTADPEQNPLSNLRKHRASRDDIGYGEASSRLEHTKGFAQNAVLVCREIDHAIGNDDVDRSVRQWNLFDLTLEKFDVFDAGLLLILTRKREHFVSHVEAIDFARWSDSPRGEQHVDSSAGAEVQDGFARIQYRER